MIDNPKTHLTIMTKNSIFSFLGLVSAELTEEGGDGRAVTAVVKHDPREGQPFVRQFETGREALISYEEAISTSIDRGWSVIFRGTPNYG